MADVHREAAAAPAARAAARSVSSEGCVGAGIMNSLLAGNERSGPDGGVYRCGAAAAQSTRNLPAV